MTMPKIGTKAPDFKLLNQNNKIVSPKQFKGKKNIVLYFYPRAMTPGCTAQACGLRDYKTKITKQKTVILGISIDSPDKLKKFEEKHHLNFDLLSDKDHNTALNYGVWGMKKFMGKEFMGLIRTSFIIGMDGKIKHIMEKVNTKTHHDDVLEWIRANLNS